MLYMYIYNTILWNKKVIIQGFCQSKYMYSNSNNFISFFSMLKTKL